MLLRALLGLLMSLLLLPVLAPSPAGGSAGSDSRDPAGDVRVAVANLREGSFLTRGPDRRDATDRRRFAHRLLTRRGRVPDIVLLQEVLGTAGAVARALDAHPRARRNGASYRVITRTHRGVDTGQCDGRRTGRFTVLRSSAILVNRATVTRVHRTGAVRTWGRWHRPAWRHTGRQGHGCTAHPWARVTVEQPGAAPRQALVTSVHAAPVDRQLKTRAVRVLQRHLDRQHARFPGAAVALGGDLNLNRCRQGIGRPERRSCQVRSAHRRLSAGGYVDAVRAAHTTGSRGVVGVARRVDFLFTPGTARAVRHDRCYRAWLVHRWPCSAKRAVFEERAVFHRCQRRSLHHGRPGGGCPPSAYRRYYSDHALIVGTIR